MKKGLVLSLGGLAVTMIAFQNCGHDVRFSEVQKLVGASATTATEIIVQNCAAAKASGRLHTKTNNIVFADTKIESGRNEVCEWNAKDNLGKVNGKNQARYEQKQNLNLPSGAVICDVQMKIDAQTIVYDDVFTLTLNDRLLASNDNTAVQTRLTPEVSIAASNGQSVDLLKMDWLAFRGSPFQNNTREDYCFGAAQGLATCKWPLTQEYGDFVFDFAPELLIDIGKRVPAEQQQIGFMVTGDDDPAFDCYHSPIAFDLQVDYYLAE